MKSLKSRLFRTCPKSGRIVGVRQPEGWTRVFFPLVGLAALVWFAVRVVPKPSRAAYPCQRVAMPLASGFVLWLAGMVGASLAIGGARRQFRQARWLSGGLAVVIALAGIGWAMASVYNASYAGEPPPRVEYTPHPVNDPIGVAKGLAPGRVVWVHDPQVTDWAGRNSGQRWYQRVDPVVASDMLATALQSYADASSTTAAWDNIFRHFNGGSAGYSPGEQIYIKINLTTSYAGSGTANINGSYDWRPVGSLNYDSIGHAPQLMHALLDQLVNAAGVDESDITIGDPTGLFINELYEPLHDDFPDVNYLDNYGQQGRTRAEFSTSPQYWSTSLAAGKNIDYPVVQQAAASYVINLAILKTHDLNGITVTAKNHFGSLLRTPVAQLRGVNGNWYNLHDNLPLPANGVQGLDDYRVLVDLNGHQDYGGKTLLYLVDAIYGGFNWDSVPSTWAMTPFNGDWPSSVFLSMDQVAIDSVAFDFLSQQWPSHALANEGVQGYLHEMALADDPPSGTFYDPENDGVRMASQGVHEHWNNPTDKQYSRNLGAGNGIELRTIEKSRACGQQTILFVGVSYPLPARDQALVARLEAAGYRTEARSESDARTIDANGKDLVIISDSVTSGNVNTKFRNVTVPVINWEPHLFDDLGMTGTVANTDYGDLANQTQVNIVDASHPLAAGLPVGLTTTTNSQQLYFWAVPSNAATVVARPAGHPGRAAIFGYETGAIMVGMNAPARRVGFFNGYGADFTAEGWALFDAAVKWALQCGSVGGGFSVIDAGTGEVVQALANGDNLELTTLPANLAIRANTDPAHTGSVRFTYDGQTVVDNTPAYDFSGLPLEWTPGVGAHTLSAQPFSQADAGGVAGEGLTVNFTVTNNPLAVTLADFAASQQGDAVLVTWETVSEVDNRGFNLYRGTTPDGPDVQLNQQLIPSQSVGSPTGFVYTWEDRLDLATGTVYYYWLEDVDVYGVASQHGPVSATFAAPTAVTLAGFDAGSNGNAVGWSALVLLLAIAIATGAVLRWQFLTRRSQRQA